jgi:hypothetical protein
MYDDIWTGEVMLRLMVESSCGAVSGVDGVDCIDGVGGADDVAGVDKGNGESGVLGYCDSGRCVGRVGGVSGRKLPRFRGGVVGECVVVVVPMVGKWAVGVRTPCVEGVDGLSSSSSISRFWFSISYSCVSEKKMAGVGAVNATLVQLGGVRVCSLFRAVYAVVVLVGLAGGLNETMDMSEDCDA